MSSAASVPRSSGSCGHHELSRLTSDPRIYSKHVNTQPRYLRCDGTSCHLLIHFITARNTMQHNVCNVQHDTQPVPPPPSTHVPLPAIIIASCSLRKLKNMHSKMLWLTGWWCWWCLGICIKSPAQV